jgi:DNA-binding NarL/FixJ family response regulator
VNFASVGRVLTLIRILIVDDFQPWRSEVAAALGKGSGFQIIAEASDGLEAVEKYAELQPDVILLDIGMPRLNGIEAARQIIQTSPGAKIVFWSEYADRELVDAAFKLGAKAYIAKSEAATDLIPAIEAVLEEMLFVSKVLGITPAPALPTD